MNEDVNVRMFDLVVSGSGIRTLISLLTVGFRARYISCNSSDRKRSRIFLTWNFMRKDGIYLTCTENVLKRVLRISTNNMFAF